MRYIATDLERLRSPLEIATLLLFFYTVSFPAMSQQDEEASTFPVDTAVGQVASPGAISAGGGRLGANYVVGPEDLLRIEIFNLQELARTVRVANDGTIPLPLLGYVRAAGLTVEELRKDLESKWGKSYLQDPQVSVFVKEFHAQPVSVVGAIEKPGIYQLTGPRTLLEMLSMAGGLAKTHDLPGRTVVVTRKGGFGTLQPVEGMRLVSSDKVEISVPRLLYSQDDGLDIDIKPFDRISVSKAEIVYVVGAVRKPGRIAFGDTEPRVTILEALAMAEGLTGSAAKSAAQIIRRAQDGSRIEIRFDLDKVLKGKSKDLEMAANDILFVPDSTGKAAGKRGLEAALATISGVAIFRAGR